jgi:hypothetical protein
MFIKPTNSKRILKSLQQWQECSGWWFSEARLSASIEKQCGFYILTESKRG